MEREEELGGMEELGKDGEESGGREEESGAGREEDEGTEVDSSLLNSILLNETQVVRRFHETIVTHLMEHDTRLTLNEIWVQRSTHVRSLVAYNYSFTSNAANAHY